MYFPKSNRAYILAMVLVCLVGCSGKEARIQSHLERGQAFYAQSDPDKALLEIRNVLQMDPKQPQAYYLAGEVEESRNDLKKAYGNYAKAVELKPDLYDAKAGLARLQFTVGADTEARRITDEILAKDPANAEARSVAAALTARKGDLDGAIKQASDVVAGNQPPTNAASILAGLYAAKGDFPAALQVIDKALVDHPNDIKLLTIAADLSRRMNQDDKAVSYLERATAAAPKRFQLWATLSDFYDLKGDYVKEEATLRAAIKADPDDSTRYIALVHFLSLRKGEDVGLKELVGIAKERTRDYPVQLALGNYYKKKGNSEQARSTYERIISTDSTSPASLTARNELAAMDLEAGDEARARARIEETLKVNVREQTALVMRARLEFMHNQYDAAIVDLRAAQRESPDSPMILTLLADAYQAAKQPTLARDTLADATKLYPDRPGIAAVWIQYLARTGQTADAIAAADSAIARSPKDPDLYRLKASLQERARDSAGAEATLAKLGEIYPRDYRIAMLQGQAFTRDKKTANALAAFDRAAALAPESNEPRAAALEVLVVQQNFVEAHRRAEAAIKAAPQLALNYQLDGNIYAAQGNVAGAEASYRKAIDADPKAASAYVNLANFLASQKRLDDAGAVLDAGVKAGAQNTALLSAQADFLTARGQYDQAIAIYEGLLKTNPTDSTAANNLAYLLTDIKGDPQSLDRALKLAKSFEFASDPRLLDTLAWTHYRMGQFAESVPILQRALSISPNSQQLELHYGMALYKSGSVDKAKEYLHAAAQGNAKLPDEARKMIDQG